MNYLIEELRWRGLIQDLTPGTEEMLSKGMATGYVGFDPTADSLHIGNLVPIMLLVHLQRAGHKPLALVGGATGLIGDPSGKSSERNLLEPEVIQHNLECQKKQLMQFLDFQNGPNQAEIVNNYDWFKGISFLEFIRDIGKHVTVNYMLAKDSVKNRLENGMSFTEFSYQLIQGYDFYYLFINRNCSLQMGGSDQWGNMVTGTEIIRRKAAAEAFALTAPLVKKADGTKFGKSEGGNVWLDRSKTSPYKFYQYWLNVSDEDARNFIRVFTLKSKTEIEELESEHAVNPQLRILQKALAGEVTLRVHSQADLEQAQMASEVLFGKAGLNQLLELDEQTFLEVFEGIPQVKLASEVDMGACSIVELLSEGSSMQIFKSKGEARRMLEAGGVSINKVKVQLEDKPSELSWIKGKYLLVQLGKKNYHLIEK
jgi:tyrosyl-tRNA synthetase